MISSNKKIAFVVWYFNFGGQEKRYYKLAYSLFKRGLDIIVYANAALREKNDTEINEILTDKTFSSNIRYIKVPYYRRKIIYKVSNKDIFVSRLNKVLKMDQTDVLITNMRLNSIAQIDKKKIKIVKDYVSPNSVDLSFSTDDIANINKADRLFFVSQTVHERFLNKLKNLSFPPILPPCTILELPFVYNDVSKLSDTTNKKNHVIFAHRLIDRKNPILFARIVKQICEIDEFKGWRFFIFGQGPLKSAVSKILKQEILSKRVRLEFINNLKEELNSSKIFVSLIEPDNFPSQSIIEAMQSKNALLLLDTGLSSKFISDNGIMVRKNEKEIMQSLIKLMSSEKLSSLQENSYNFVRENFSQEKYIQSYIDGLEKL